MSAYSSSYAPNDFFSPHHHHNANGQPTDLNHLGQQQPSHHEPMIFHPAPTYYAQDLIGYPPPTTHQDAATAFHFYQPGAQPPWPDTSFDVGYPNTQFDYSGIGATSTTATANGLKHWSAVDQFATVPLLSSAASVLNSTNNVLAANFSSAINGDSLTNSAGNGETLTSLDHREFLDGRVEQDREKSGATQHLRSSTQQQRHPSSPPSSLTYATQQQRSSVKHETSNKTSASSLSNASNRPQRALNARQLQLQNPQAKIFTCGQCNRQYCRKSTLKAHMKQHDGGERQFVCECCGKTFTQAANLTAHQRVHTGEKPFACSICLRPFSQSSSLVTHKRTHTGERPYPCPHCTKSFTDSSTLTKHMRTHSGHKPYSCHLCMMRFSQSGNLHRHMKTHRGYNP